MWRCFSLISRNALQLFRALLRKDPVPIPHFSLLAIVISSYSYLINILWNDSSIYSASHLSFLSAFWKRCWGRCSAAVEQPMHRELRALCTSSWENPAKGSSHIQESFWFQWVLLTLAVFSLFFSSELTKHTTEFFWEWVPKGSRGQEAVVTLGRKEGCPCEAC